MAVLCGGNNKKMSRITVIGAGKTGRGFVARLLAEAGETITFVDKDRELVQQLQEKADSGDGYRVYFFGDVREPVKISNYRAVCWENADFSDTDYIFVSVGGTNLEETGRELSERLPEDRPVYIITCENASDPAGVLSAAIHRDNVKVSQAAVFCTTTEKMEKEEKPGLDISSENYPYLPYDLDRLSGGDPDVTGIRPVKGFGNFLTRKIFTYNAASAVIAYLGYIRGYTDYGQAGNDREILTLLDRNYEVTNRALCEEFGYEPADQADFARLSREKFTSTVIRDTVARNAREPQRKLGANERIIGPMKLIRQHGGNPEVLMMTAAAALLYDGEGETAWREIRKEKSPEQILKEISGLTEAEQPLIDGIMKYYRRFSGQAKVRSLFSLREQILQTEAGDHQAVLYYLGQTGFLIRFRGKTILIDGYLSDYVDRNCSGTVTWKRLYPAPARPDELDFVDYVFCTHTHFDHADPDTLRGILRCNQKAVFAGPESVCRAYRSYGIPEQRILKLVTDQKTVLAEARDEISVTMIPAAHEELHPDGGGGYEEAGYVFSLGGFRIYHSGDCCPYDGLEQRIMNCDVEIMPVNGRDYYRRYVQDIIGCFSSREAALIAAHTGAGLLVPVHWDLYEVNSVNPAEVVDEIRRTAPGQAFHIFMPGEKYILSAVS